MQFNSYKSLFRLGLLLFLCIPFTECFSKKTRNPRARSKTTSENQEVTKKQQQWLDMEKEVHSWTDKLGMPIDLGIKDTVIVLNLLGFKTSASCQGHLDWGLPYPWIDFETTDQEVKNLMEKQQSVYQKIQKNYPAGDYSSPDLANLYKEIRTLNDEIQRVSLLKLISLKQLLDEFYSNHHTHPDRMIRIHQLNPTFLRLYSIGGDWQITRNDTEKVAKLKEYQEEMHELTNFLIAKYYNQNKQRTCIS
jgi:hypothetical protein